MRPSFFKDRYVLSFLIGGIGVALTSMRYSIQPLAWIAYAPLLAPLFIEGGKKRHLWLLAIVLIAIHVVVAKIVTPPVTYIMLPMFALPISLIVFVTIAGAAWTYRVLGVRWGIYLLPALAVTFEWLQYSFSDQSTWGALAFTQTQNLSLMQFTSLFGIAGVSFLVGLGSSLAAAVAVEGWHPLRSDVTAFLIVVLAAHFYGEVRLQHDAPGTPIRIAAVASPFAVEETRPMFMNPDLARGMDAKLWSRTSQAADLGAKVIVWNEAATMMRRDDELAFVEAGKALAARKQIDLVMAYGVLLSADPPQFENKYLWIRADGSIADEYWKRHPVPGEGSIRGKKAAQVIAFPEGKISGAICYDYDFPEISLAHVRSGAGLTVLPSSDWRGIDPLHSDMARFMGVAAGISVVRSVRSATSFASDPYGRLKGAMRFYEPGPGVMIADVSAVSVPTLYAWTGDVLPWITAAFSLFALTATVRRRRRPGGNG